MGCCPVFVINRPHAPADVVSIAIGYFYCIFWRAGTRNIGVKALLAPQYPVVCNTSGYRQATLTCKRSVFRFFSLDVLDHLANPLDRRLDLDNVPRDLYVVRFRADRVRFAEHLLGNKL